MSQIHDFIMEDYKYYKILIQELFTMLKRYKNDLSENEQIIMKQFRANLIKHQSTPNELTKCKLENFYLKNEAFINRLRKLDFDVDMIIIFIIEEYIINQTDSSISNANIIPIERTLLEDIESRKKRHEVIYRIIKDKKKFPI